MLSGLTSAQWNVGASYKFKSDVPDKGVGINVSRNLPVQSPDFGFKIRAEIDLFRSSEIDAQGNKRNFLSEDYRAELITTFFFRNFYPYFGFGGGYGHININNLNKGSALFSFLAGVRLPLSIFFYPYVEIQGLNYFANLNEPAAKNISSFQLRGTAGVMFLLNSIE